MSESEESAYWEFTKEGKRKFEALFDWVIESQEIHLKAMLDKIKEGEGTSSVQRQILSAPIALKNVILGILFKELPDTPNDFFELMNTEDFGEIIVDCLDHELRRFKHDKERLERIKHIEHIGEPSAKIKESYAFFKKDPWMTWKKIQSIAKRCGTTAGKLTYAWLRLGKREHKIKTFQQLRKKLQEITKE